MFNATDINSASQACYLIHLLEKLVSLRFWWPSLETGGQEVADYIHHERHANFYSDMCSLVNHYVFTIPQICEEFSIAKAVLSNPKTLWLLELY